VIETIKQIIKKKFEGELVVTEELSEYLYLLENTNENYFITGKAGTGKTTLIEMFRKMTKKKVVVLAPTGLAAINARGQTIHSFFKFPPRMIHEQMIRRHNDNSLYKDVDTIIIDEASMLRADMLDAIDKFLRLNAKDKNRPFGGIQIVLVGDLFQLPPVISREENDIYYSFYETPYFFSAHTFSLDLFQVLLLDKVFRQADEQFVNVLNTIRDGNASIETLLPINSRITKNSFNHNHIILCTTNAAADGINEIKLNAINANEHEYEATLEGSFLENYGYLPVTPILKLKKGARVLFIKNDSGGRWVNGTLGTVHKLKGEQIQVKLDNNEIVDVDRETWTDIKYRYNENTKAIEEETVGKVYQYPLKLAWAITIHKSQGMTFDKVCLDFRRAPFAHGQTYVALSRCRTLEGITLTKNIYPNDVLVDRRIVEFYVDLIR
jgi:ATP-dependent DNA helicase PIF1